MAMVLVASSEGELRRLAAAHLAGGGHQSLLSADAVEAMQLIGGGSVSAALVDLALPDPGGVALVERIRIDGSCGGMPVLAVLPEGVTGRERAFRADLVLTRPLEREALGRALDRLLAVRPGSSPTGPSGSGGGADLRRLCHDLNNPLAVILGQLEVIAQRHPDLPAEAIRRLLEIKDSAESMQRKIADAGAGARALGEGG
jgi:CheY-like chemotaxis protein